MNKTAPFDLVIFDCDGVLIDSNGLIATTNSTLLRELGHALSPEEIITHFHGVSEDNYEHMLREKFGYAGDFEAVKKRWRELYSQISAHGVTLIADVHIALDKLTTPTCVASNRRQADLLYHLQLVGLAERFHNRAFGVDLVKTGKPAPDIYLHAARMCGVSPTRCAVVEDSPPGIASALAAGMTVFAYKAETEKVPADPRATVFTHMAELPQLLNASRNDL